jgi:hypothetical protein
LWRPIEANIISAHAIVQTNAIAALGIPSFVQRLVHTVSASQ